MRWTRRTPPRISVVVPVYDVEAYLSACLDSVLAADWPDLEVVVVDDGSTDGSGALADDHAARDPRVRVVHTANRGLGAARNEGLRHTTGPLVTFADSDDRVPADAYAVLHRQLHRSGCDFVTGSVAWWHPEAADVDPARELVELPWMRRLHRDRAALVVEQHPELLGDVFAWNKLFRRNFWDASGLSWVEGRRYEDQPTTTRAYLRARRFGVVPDVVYHWRQRSDGSSITQQRTSLDDLRDRWATKLMAQADVAAYGSDRVSKVFTDRVLPGDLHRYFRHLPEADDDWWELLRAGITEVYADRSLVHSGLPPVHRLTGWLVEQGRREDAVHVMAYLAGLAPGERVPRVQDDAGVRLDVPGLDPRGVDRAALALRDDES